MNSVITPFGFKGWKHRFVAEQLGYDEWEILAFMNTNVKRIESESQDRVFVYVSETQTEGCSAYLLTAAQIVVLCILLPIRTPKAQAIFNRANRRVPEMVHDSGHDERSWLLSMMQLYFRRDEFWRILEMEGWPFAEPSLNDKMSKE